MIRQPLLLARLPLLLLGLVVSLAVLANAASRLLEKEFPAQALKANPLNSQAVVEIGSRQFLDATVSSRARDLDLYERAKTYSPADARLFSLLGIAQESDGDLEAARQNYSHALYLLPTEIQALVRVFIQDVDDRRFESATRKMELVIRRWSQYFGSLAPYVIEMSYDKDGIVALEEMGKNFPSGRARIISILAGLQGNLPAAYQMVQNWHASGLTPLNDEVKRLESILIQKRRRNAAYELFHQTRSETESAQAGYVFNSSFSLPFSGSVFDWHTRKQTGVIIRRVEEAHSDTRPQEQRQFLNVRFLGNPLQFRNISQTLRLPAGSYRLELLFAMKDLKTPKPLELQIVCSDVRKTLVTLEVPNGTSGPSTLDADMKVPSGECLFAKLAVSHAFVPLSFQNRFEGELNIYDLRLTRISN